MTQIEAFIAEFDREAVTTRKLLDAIPEDRLDWKPHERSSTLRKLALHVAGLPGGLAQAALSDDFSFGGKTSNDAATRADILAAFEGSIAKFHDALGQLSDEKLQERWTAKFGDKTVIDMKRVGVIRTMLLNHWYHHRGQLSVYLRMLDVPLPSIYGPSANENPFA